MPMAAVLSLLHLADSSDLLSGVTRTLIVWVLNLIGTSAADKGGYLAVGGSLNIPWTQDCAGLNILVLLWSVVLWVHRAEALARSTWVRLALAVPAAFVANVLRVLTVIGYRAAFYPEVESPQLHYFMGFLWVLPFLGLVLRIEFGEVWERGVEAVHLAVTLSLLAAVADAPGGTLAALAALVVLGSHRPADGANRPFGSVRTAAMVTWLVAAAIIAGSRMESLWIPWLLLCPWYAPIRLLLSPDGLALLAGTIPLIAMHPVARLVVLAALAWRIFRLLRRPIAPPVPEVASASASRPAPFHKSSVLTLALTLPLWAPLVGDLSRDRSPAPPGVMARTIDASTQSLRVLGQSPEIELAWFAPTGGGRHHPLPVCMRYRGVTLLPTEDEGVMTDGRRWMREFFLQDGQILRDYASYLRSTFAPFSSAGIHIIASASVDSMSAAAFAETVDRLADEIHRLEAGPATTRAAR